MNLNTQLFFLYVNLNNYVFLFDDIFTRNNTDNFGGNVWDGLFSGLSRIVSLLGGVLTGLIEAIKMLYDALIDITAWIDNMITALNTGNVSGLPILQGVGAYRYLVGDLVFYLTYVTIVIGCLFTIYKLFQLIYKEISGSMQSSFMSTLFNKM
jgi:hypothetical protein|nr:hypothetical protein [uncultured Lachnoclostridium sp.]